MSNYKGNKKYYTMSPSRIDSFNKFLCELDKKSLTINNNESLNNNNESLNNNNESLNNNNESLNNNNESLNNNTNDNTTIHKIKILKYEPNFIYKLYKDKYTNAVTNDTVKMKNDNTNTNDKNERIFDASIKNTVTSNDNDMKNEQVFLYVDGSGNTFTKHRISDLFGKYDPSSIVKDALLKNKNNKTTDDLDQSTNDKQDETILTEEININEEINNIDDLLSLINKYKPEKHIKYNININALHNIKEPLTELNNMIGMKQLKINIVDQIIYFIQNLHKNTNTNANANTNVSSDFLHTVIYGPPGTGKTEVAKIMGKIFSKIGILKRDVFKKVTRSDLVAGYLGQTAIKTKDVIKDCLGGVLFIDEAYALGNTEKRDSFSKECIDTLCEALSDHKDNLMVIIAGYETELKECFFNYNQGLDSRFTWRFKTDEYKPIDLFNIFMKKVNDIGWTLHPDTIIGEEWFKKNMDYFQFFGRDIETLLAKTKIAHSKRVFCKDEGEKRKITLTDLNNGFNMFMKNDNVKERKEKLNFKNILNNSLYS